MQYFASAFLATTAPSLITNDSKVSTSTLKILEVGGATSIDVNVEPLSRVIGPQTVGVLKTHLKPHTNKHYRHDSGVYRHSRNKWANEPECPHTLASGQTSTGGWVASYRCVCGALSRSVFRTPANERLTCWIANIHQESSALSHTNAQTRNDVANRSCD